MERKITNELLKWKRDSLNKVFCLYGPRQVGKTYSVLMFGKKYYKNIAYFNTLNNIELNDILNTEKSLDKLIMKLSLLSGESIFPEDTLIVFDNANKSDFLKQLKLFNNKSNYHVIVITSNIDSIKHNRLEEIYYRSMNVMDFEEYLVNTDKNQLIDFIKDSYETMEKMPFHQMALDTYYDYLLTGGFPEVVDCFLACSNDLLIESIKQKILDIYESEYINYDNNNLSYLKTKEIYDNMGIQLLKSNKKFQYGVIKKGARSKDYETNINILKSNELINISYKLKQDFKSPLTSSKEEDSFKLYYNDSGLLYSKLFLTRSKLLTNDDIRRVVIENNIANVLTNLGFNLYYYQSDGKAEIDFILQNRMGEIIPVEIVNNKLTKAKSLSLFLSKYNLTKAIRISEDNFSKKKDIINIPCYATFCIK